MEQFVRTETLIGPEGMEKLKNSAVIVFGIGGVGSFAAEALARSGVGRLGLVDGDKVCITNINRQLVAGLSTIGRLKVEVMRERISDINEEAKVDIYPIVYSQENADEINLGDYDYILDAIDTVSAKLVLIEKAKELNVPIISCMGAGNKLDPAGFKVADIEDTSRCPLAKVIRKELRTRNISGVKVVYSEEEPKVTSERGQPPGSIAFVPSAAGLIAAGEVIRELLSLR